MGVSNPGRRQFNIGAESWPVIIEKCIPRPQLLHRCRSVELQHREVSAAAAPVVFLDEALPRCRRGPTEGDGGRDDGGRDDNAVCRRRAG